MAAQYSIDPAQLSQSASKVGAQATEIMGRIGEVMKEVQASRAFWTGQASGQYEALMADWNKTATQVHTALDNTVQALSRAAAEYDTTEAANTTRFAG